MWQHLPVPVTTQKINNRQLATKTKIQEWDEWAMLQ
jgi:hypothetical protein